MEIVNIQMEKRMPLALTVEISIPEAAAIACLFGNLNGHGRAKLGIDLRVPDDHNDGPYRVLTDLLNRFWDEGVDDIIPGGSEYILETLNMPIVDQ